MSKYCLPFFVRVGLFLPIVGCASLGIMPAIAFDQSQSIIPQQDPVDPTHWAREGWLSFV